MHILLLGAGGFIGRHILADLLAHGHDVTAVVRSVENLADAVPTARLVAIDLAQATRPNDWIASAKGVDVIVNAAGLLRGPDMDAVHEAMPRALYAAAEAEGVARAVLISAISARPDVATDYSRSKLAGEDVLRNSGIEWTILRPSLVYGDGSYGGTSLMRGLAALPGFFPLAGKGDFAFSPIHAADLARTVRITCENDFSGRTLEPAGPHTLSLRELLLAYRQWLGFGHAPTVSIPLPLMKLMGRAGDHLGDGPVSTNSLVQMIAGNGGDGGAFAQAIGFQPRSLADALRDHPAQVQDRWHARLFFLAPAIKAILALMWLCSAVLGIIYGRPTTLALVDSLGLPTSLAGPLIWGTALLDTGIAWLVLIDRAARWSTPAQIITIIGYTIIIGFALPGFWLDPLGPLMKNVPVLALVLVHGAIGHRR